MVTEQLVYFTGMTRIQLPDFGDKTLIPFLCQFHLDGFLFVVVFFYHACKSFALIFAFFPLVFVVSIHSFRMYVQEFPYTLCLFDTLLFCEHELYDTSYSGVWFPPDRQS